MKCAHAWHFFNVLFFLWKEHTEILADGSQREESPWLSPGLADCCYKGKPHVWMQIAKQNCYFCSVVLSVEPPNKLARRPWELLEFVTSPVARSNQEGGPGIPSHMTVGGSRAGKRLLRYIARWWMKLLARSRSCVHACVCVTFSSSAQKGGCASSLPRMKPELSILVHVLFAVMVFHGFPPPSPPKIHSCMLS